MVPDTAYNSSHAMAGSMIHRFHGGIPTQFIIPEGSAMDGPSLIGVEVCALYNRAE